MHHIQNLRTLKNKKIVNKCIRCLCSTAPKLSNEPLSVATKPPMVDMFINDQAVTVPAGTSILNACKMSGVKVPHFCYHERLNIAGNCRMCLVEVNKSPKPIASCAMPVSNGMKVYPDSDLSKRAREGVMELLLVNHPLDCPICDQGGECDLQDQSMKYGSDRSRFVDMEYTGKRAVPEASFGPLVKTIMTRCIHCTRCIRFAREVGGCEDLGTTERGNKMEVGTFIQGKVLESELSGNVIDLCPVGALTSHPYAFNARPWELQSTKSIDVMDALGSNITINTRADDLMRILPSVNEDINEEWITDKCRFSYDGLKNQRLLEPMIFSKEKKLLEKASWKSCMNSISDNFKRVLKYDSVGEGEIAAVFGPFVDVETMVATKDLLNSLNSESLCLEENFHLPSTGCDIRSSYLLNTTLKNMQDCDLCFIIGCNPRFESPLLNSRIRKGWFQNNMKICYVGPKVDLNYEYEHIGDSISVLDDIMKGTHGISGDVKKCSKPLLLFGQDCFSTSNIDYQNIIKFSNYLKFNSKRGGSKDVVVFNMMHKSASTTGALDVGINSNTENLTRGTTTLKILILVGADKKQILDKLPIDKNTFVVYIGHHGDYGATLSDVVLPSASYTEKSSTFINNEGRSQCTERAVYPLGASRDDWKIVTAISHVIGQPLKYKNIDQMRERTSEISPTLLRYDAIQPLDLNNLILQLDKLKNTTTELKKPLNVAIKNISQYYVTDCITRASRTMNKSRLATKRQD